MNDVKKKYQLHAVIDERVRHIDKATGEKLEDMARGFFLCKESPLSDAWEEMGWFPVGVPNPVRCSLGPVVQEIYDYEDLATKEIESATFDFKFQILAVRKADSIAFCVWCVVPVGRKSDNVLIRMNFEKAKMALESFSGCPCKPGKPCKQHEPPWQEKVYGSYQVQGHTH